MSFDTKGNEEYYSSKNQRRGNLAKKKHFNNNKYKGNSGKKYGNPKSSKLTGIYYDTVKHFSSMKNFVCPNAMLYNVNEIYLNIPENKETFETIVTIMDQDSLDMAMQFCNDGLEKPMVLNMASDYKPGGGVKSGKMAQEECLFRRTNAFMTHLEDFYPLEEDQVIYSPELFIVKNSEYDYLDEMEQVTISMIAVPAIRKPRLVDGNYDDDDRILMQSKIESIFKIAIINGHDSLVLGALGCGVFRNPPDEVAQMFKTMITTYGKFFKRIGFAILNVKDKDAENLVAFKKKFA